MNRTIRGVAALAAVTIAGIGLAQEKKDGRPKADPKGTPLELTITGKKTEYVLDTGGLSSTDYRKMIEAALKEKGGMRPPPPPAVDLVVELTNTSDKPVRVWTKGDPVVLELDLKGKGAVNGSPPLAFTADFRIPEGTEIAPAKSVTFPVKSLRSGFRGASKFSYWTAPGDYDLVA